MASALQAVFARLGNVPPPPAAPQLDTNANNSPDETRIIMVQDPILLKENSTIPNTEKHMISGSRKIKSERGHMKEMSGTSMICVTEHESECLAGVMQGTSSASNNLPWESGQPVFGPSATIHFAEEVTFTFENLNYVLEVKKTQADGMK